MPNSFPRVRGLFGAESAKGWIVLGAFSLAVAVAWLVWLSSGEVTLVERATRARLESSAYVHPVESVAGGRVVDLPVGLGDRVEVGDLLLALETEHPERALDEARAQLGAWRERLAASLAAFENFQRMAAREQELAERQLAEVEAKREVELIKRNYARKAAERMETLFEAGLVSEVDLVRHEGDVEQANAEVEVRESEAVTLQARSRRDTVKQAAELGEIEADIGEARGQISALEARVELLLHEIEDLQVRAPVAGRVGWLAPLRLGSVAEAGDRLVEIVPDDAVRVVGYFPLTAVGRLKVGQSARFRLDALPWTRYGAVELSLERLATEAESGEVRVELGLVDEPQLPLAHGMTGGLEVAVEQMSPARWLLQAIGRAAPQGQDAG